MDKERIVREVVVTSVFIAGVLGLSGCDVKFEEGPSQGLKITQTREPAPTATHCPRYHSDEQGNTVKDC
jgi:hypothetical protein